MGILDILRGVADQADFIPGLDPNKDKRGLIAQLLGGGQQQMNPNGLPGPMGPGAQQAATAPGGAIPMSNPYQEYAKPRGLMDSFFMPGRVKQMNDAGHEAFLETKGLNAQAQQSAATRAAADQTFVQNAQTGGFGADEIARMKMARNANPEEFGKSFAGNFGFNSAAEGSEYSRFGGAMEKNAKTPTPIDPSKLAIDQQNADASTLTAEASMHRAKNPSPMILNKIGSSPEEYASALLNPDQGTGKDPAVVFDANGRILVSPNQQQSVFAADAMKFNEMNAKFDLAASEMDRAIASIDTGASSGPWSVTQHVPVFGGQTPAGALANSLKTIKARIGFDELQAMRDASPTGGALGQVSEREIDFLQSLMGSLDQDQDPKILRENLVTIRNFLLGRQSRYETAFGAKYPTLEENVERRADAESNIEDLVNKYAE